MINVTIHREQNGHITAFEISGHAHYAEKGKDIVCAGVSAVSVGTVNALESLLPLKLSHSMKEGLLIVNMPTIANKEVQEQAQLLLESMLVMLTTIEQSYGQYIRINDYKV